MPTTQQQAAYHCSIDKLLTAAYQREFDQREMGKCKTKYPRVEDWLATLSDEQRERVETELKRMYR